MPSKYCHWEGEIPASVLVAVNVVVPSSQIALFVGFDTFIREKIVTVTGRDSGLSHPEGP